jgi:hypothetical protein
MLKDDQVDGQGVQVGADGDRSIREPLRPCGHMRLAAGAAGLVQGHAGCAAPPSVAPLVAGTTLDAQVRRCGKVRTAVIGLQQRPHSSCSSTRSWSARAKHLFEGGSDQVPLKLLDSRPHSNGVVGLRYTRAD